MPTPTAPLTSHGRSSDGSRWLRVSSSHPDVVNPDIEELVGTLGDLEDAALAILLAAPHPDLDRIVSRLTEAVSPVPLIGCTTAGLVDAYGATGAALQMILLGGPGLEAAVVHASLDDHSPREAGEIVAGALDHVDTDHNAVLLLLTEGLEANLSQIVRGAYSVAGMGIPLVGGCAGDDSAMTRTLQFANGAVLDRAIVAAAITSTGSFGLGVSHGWQPVGEPLIVTGTDGTEILTIDDRPALDVYLEVLGVETAITDPGAFARFAQTRPLGLKVTDGAQVRFVRGADLDRRSLQFLVPVPEGELVWVMSGDQDSILHATADAADQVVDQLGTAPFGTIAFDCVARRGVLGDSRLPAEIAELQSRFGAGAIGGFYTYGEIARNGGALGFHHQTMVVLGLS